TGPAAADVQAAPDPLAARSRLLATVRSVGAEEAAVPAGEPYVLSVHGADRLGIVAAVTRVLADAGGNITDLTTRLAGPLYVLVAEVDLLPGSAEATELRLNEAAAGLGVDVVLRRAES